LQYPGRGFRISQEPLENGDQEVFLVPQDRYLRLHSTYEHLNSLYDLSSELTSASASEVMMSDRSSSGLTSSLSVPDCTTDSQGYLLLQVSNPVVYHPNVVLRVLNLVLYPPKVRPESVFSVVWDQHGSDVLRTLYGTMAQILKMERPVSLPIKIRLTTSSTAPPLRTMALQRIYSPDGPENI
ncbi:hypothetical protein KCU89_g63, partial [Aureobasidium melanogenum]